MGQETSLCDDGPHSDHKSILNNSVGRFKRGVVLLGSSTRLVCIEYGRRDADGAWTTLMKMGQSKSQFFNLFQTQFAIVSDDLVVGGFGGTHLGLMGVEIEVVGCGERRRRRGIHYSLIDKRTH